MLVPFRKIIQAAAWFVFQKGLTILKQNFIESEPFDCFLSVVFIHAVIVSG